MKGKLTWLLDRLIHPEFRDHEIIRTLSGLQGARPFLYEFKLGPLFLISAWMLLFRCNYSGTAEQWLLFIFGGGAVIGILSVHKTVMRFLYRIAQFEKPIEGPDRTFMVTAEAVTLLGFLVAGMLFLFEFESAGFGL